MKPYRWEDWRALRDMDAAQQMEAVLGMGELGDFREVSALLGWLKPGNLPAANALLEKAAAQKLVFPSRFLTALIGLDPEPAIRVVENSADFIFESEAPEGVAEALFINRKPDPVYARLLELAAEREIALPAKLLKQTLRYDEALVLTLMQNSVAHILAAESAETVCDLLSCMPRNPLAMQVLLEKALDAGMLFSAKALELLSLCKSDALVLRAVKQSADSILVSSTAEEIERTLSLLWENVPASDYLLEKAVAAGLPLSKELLAKHTARQAARAAEKRPTVRDMEELVGRVDRWVIEELCAMWNLPLPQMLAAASAGEMERAEAAAQHSRPPQNAAAHSAKESDKAETFAEQGLPKEEHMETEKKSAAPAEARPTRKDMEALVGRVDRWVIEELCAMWNLPLPQGLTVGAVAKYQEILELAGCDDPESVTAQDLEEMAGLVEPQLLAEFCREYNRSLPNNLLGTQEDEQAGDGTALGSLILLAALLGGSAAGGQKQSGGSFPFGGRRCDGNCSACPPHYGYRYGRWYYGHDHVHGCEFGGNRGAGGMR